MLFAATAHVCKWHKPAEDCGAQNSAAIGGTADITGLEAAGGLIENDPEPTKMGSKSRSAASS
jgi:hypothetical protein